MGVFLPVLRTSFNVRLYAAFMRAYAAYRRPQNIEFYSIRQKTQANGYIGIRTYRDIVVSDYALHHARTRSEVSAIQSRGKVRGG